MTTITALNVRLGMDVSNFSEGANLAKGEVTKVASIMRQSVPASEKYKQELDLLNRAFSETGKKSQEYANGLDFLAKKYQQGAFATKELSDEEIKRQSLQERGKQLTKSLASAEEQYWKRFAEFKELRKAGAITEETYARALQQSRKTLEAARATTDTAIAAAKKLKEETARLAEAEKQRQAVMERGKQLTQSVEKSQEGYNRKIREYRELLKAGAIDQETYRRAVERSNKTMKESQTAASGAMSGIKQLAAAYLGVQTVAKSISLASEVEDATIAFEVLTGSAQNGKLIFEQIRKFAAESPITFSGATQAAKTMMSFGVAAQDVQKNLQMLSDVTGGNNDRFKMLSLAFSQTSAAGRLMGQDLLQMVNAGFNPLQQISKTTGESMIELKKRMEDGGISAEEVRKAFQDATAEGGMFHGMTDRLAQTVSGKLNIALSDLEQKLAKTGEQLGPLIAQLLDAFNDLEPVIDLAVQAVGMLAQAAGFIVAAIQDLADVKRFKFDLENLNKFYDEYEKRERALAAAAEENINQEFQKKNNAANEAKQAELKAAREVAAAKIKAMEEQKKAAEQAAKDQLKEIEKQQKTKLKAIEDARKAQERAAKQAQEAFQQELEAARKQAIDFFEKKKKENDQRRADVAKGPGGGMELDSADAAKFAADAVNVSIAKTAVPEDPIVLQRDVAKKTAELLMVSREQLAQEKIATDLARMQLAEMKENGFRRIR